MANETESNKLQAISEQLRSCYGYGSDKVGADRIAALDYYYQRPRGDEVEGCSTVVSGDLSAMVEATLAQMMEAFSGPNLADFGAYGAEDEDQAALESATVQHYVMKVNPGYIEILQAVKDALLQRNGVMKVWINERKTVRRTTLLGVTPEVIAEALTPKNPNVTVEVTSYDPDKGEARFRVTMRRPKMVVRAVPPENFFYLPNTDTLAETSFCAERQFDTRSDLVLMGFDKAKVYAIPAWVGSVPQASTMRVPGQTVPVRQGFDESQELVQWLECYQRRDDGTGVSEIRRVAVAFPSQTSVEGGAILSDEPVDRVPYAIGSAIINPHELTGISLYDKLRQTQDVSTGLQRALLDNVEAVNRPKLAALDGLVNQDDLDNQRVTGTIRVRSSAQDVSLAIMPLVIPDISPGLLQNLEYQRSLRTEMGGASLDLAAGSMQLNDRLGSQGLDRAYSVMEQLAALMTKTLAESLIRGLFLLAHETMRGYYDYPLPIKLGGRWLAQAPMSWPVRESVTVRPGMSPGERTRRSAALSTLAQHQTEMSARGLDNVLVGLDQYYALIMDWARSEDIPNPERYYIDPRTQGSLQMQQQKNHAAMFSEDKETAFLAQAVELEQIRTAMDKYKVDVETSFKYWEATLRAEIEEAKLVAGAGGQMLLNMGADDAERESESETGPESSGTGAEPGG